MHVPEVLHFFRTFTWAPGLFFFQIFQTLPGYVLHLTCLFYIFWTFSSSYICAHSPDAPEVPHSFQDILPSTKAVLIQIFWTLPEHVLHLTHLFSIFQGSSANHPQIFPCVNTWQWGFCPIFLMSLNLCFGCSTHCYIVLSLVQF